MTNVLIIPDGVCRGFNKLNVRTENKKTFYVIALCFECYYDYDNEP